MPIEVYEDGKRVTAIAQYVPKLHILNYQKNTGIVINTYYTIAELTNIEDIKRLAILASNTGALAREHSLRITIDGEAFEVTNNGMNDNTLYFPNMGIIGTIATNPSPNMNAVTDFGFGWYCTDDVPDWRTTKKVGGHSVKIEWRIDEAVQAGENFQTDIIYTKLEAV